MLPLISVIVPVYKVEPYLCKCVDSILAQTHTNLEIILVDDGSPDNCGAICDEYAKADPRIKVIHKKNGGLSDARNAGMDIMTGKYVAFVDSDDWIEPDMYRRLLEFLEHYDADMAFGGVADDVVRNDTVETAKVSDYGDTPFAEDKISAMKRYFNGSWAAWDKLYRAELFDGIRYPVGEINEDEAIVLHLLERCKQVCYTNEVFYHYMKRADGTSITSAAYSEKKTVWVKHCRDNLEFIREKHPELEEYALARYRGSLIWSLTQISLMEHGLDNEWKRLRREIRANLVSFQRHADAKTRTKLLLLGFFPRKCLHQIFMKRRGI